jgi:hypothetical protein
VARLYAQVRQLVWGGEIRVEADNLEQLELAHGFNEELTILLNSAVVTARLIGPEHPAAALIVEMKHAAIRCAELARRLAC